MPQVGKLFPESENLPQKSTTKTTLPLSCQMVMCNYPDGAGTSAIIVGVLMKSMADAVYAEGLSLSQVFIMEIITHCKPFWEP